MYNIYIYIYIFYRSGSPGFNVEPSMLLSQNRTDAWLANSTKEALNPMVQLLDSGNLVLRDENEENPESYLEN